jgi:alkylation response protein AidB-like acyl-CoA dehydrogenase
MSTDRLAQAGQLVSAAEATRDQARHAAEQAEQAEQLTQQEATRAQAAEQAALAETVRSAPTRTGVVCLSYGVYGWAAFFLVLGALNLAGGCWYITIARSTPART